MGERGKCNATRMFIFEPFAVYLSSNIRNIEVSKNKDVLSIALRYSKFVIQFRYFPISHFAIISLSLSAFNYSPHTVVNWLYRIPHAPTKKKAPLEG
jgi:hypothetical protein